MPRNGMSASQRARHQRALERAARALELTAAGRTQREIAGELEISQQAVQKLLKRAEADALANVRDTVLAQKVRQTVRLEGLYREAMRSWHASRGEVTKRTAKQVGSGREAVTSTQIQTEQREGDVSYLNAAIGIMADLRRIWGLDAPTKLQHTTPADEAAELGSLTDEELAQYLALTEKMTPAAGAR